jgi:uncharacterized coiled-coil protein SlyX
LSRARYYNLALLSLRITILGLALFTLFGGHYPPLLAQNPIPVLTVEDAVQDNNIRALNEHLAATDAHVQRQYESLSRLATDLAGIQGEERLIGVLLGSGMSISIFLQVKKREV